MPVQIIFRGLILFRFPEPPDPDAGKLVAQLINKLDIPRRPRRPTADRPPHGPHEHNHDAQIQIATDHGAGDERTPLDLVPQTNNRDGERIDITAIGADGNDLRPEPVRQSRSFREHVPLLSSIIERGTPRVQEMRDNQGDRDGRLIRNIITVNRGTVRARQMVTWDEGGFPLLATPPGEEPAWPGLVRFVGSDVTGYVASEFVVDIDAPGVRVQSSMNNRLNRSHSGRGNLNHRVPYDMTEILFTNYEYQENTPLPYGFDFQWLFEAAGYPAVDLAGPTLDEFAGIAAGFNAPVYENERRMLLDPVDTSGVIDSYRLGRPFPYLVPDPNNPVDRGRLASTDEQYRPICIGGRE